MVSQGEVKETEKKGNDKADRYADKAIIDGNKVLKELTEVFCSRQKAYTAFMDRVRKFIAKVKVAEQELRANMKKQENPKNLEPQM